MSKLMSHIKEDLASLKDWYFAIFSALSGFFVPFIGGALAFAGLFSKRHLWREDQEKYRNLRNFTIISLLLNCINLVAIILTMFNDEPDLSSELLRLLFKI